MHPKVNTHTHRHQYQIYKKTATEQPIPSTWWTTPVDDVRDF
jgi:hypothetical protein